MDELLQITIDPAKLAQARGSLPQEQAAATVGISKQRLSSCENGREARAVKRARAVVSSLQDAN